MDGTLSGALSTCHSLLLLNLWLSNTMATPGVPGYNLTLNFFTSDSKVYRDLAMELIFLCRFLVEEHDQCLNSSTQLGE
jgi:hypothetical protein